MWTLYNLAITFFETWLLFYFCQFHLPWRVSRGHPALWLACALLSEALQQLNILYASRNLGLITCMGLDLLFITLLFRGNFFDKCYPLFLYYTLTLLTEISVIAAFSLLGDYSLTQPLSGNFIQVATTLVSKGVILTVGRLLHFHPHLHELRPDGSKKRVTLGSLGTTIAVVVYALPVDQPLQPWHVAITVSLAALGLLLTITFVPAILQSRQNKIATRQQRSETEVVQNQLRLYQDHLQEYEQRLHRQEHDLRHHLDYAATLLIREGDEKKAVTHLNRAAATFSNAGVETFRTGNTEVDAILYSFQQKAAAQQIQLTLTGLITPQLFTDPLDLCVLLYNLLENAFEATVKLSPSHKKITLVLRQEKNALFFRVFNLTDQNEDFQSSHKQLRRSHGHGLKRVQEIVNKYEGILEITQRNKLVDCYVYLQEVCAKQQQVRKEL